MSRVKPVVVFGAGGHGKVIADILEKMSGWEVLGFLDSSKTIGSLVMGYKVLGNEEILKDLPAETECVIAIGDNWTRYQVEKRILGVNPAQRFASAIHPTATVAREVQIGPGTVIMAGAIVNSCTKVGRHCKVNTGASVDHDNTIGDFGAVEPGAVLGGTVSVGEFSTIALGARVKHGISIGPHSVIGAGSTVLSDIPDHCVAYGTPARVIRSRREDSKYL